MMLLLVDASMMFSSEMKDEIPCQARTDRIAWSGVMETTISQAAVDMEAEIERQKREVVIDNCRLRSERQILFRLPVSKAIVFAFKTYQYTLDEVKKDGYADQLAEAIDGLRAGNVPEMDIYKRGVVWREPVLEYLKS